MSSHHKQAPPHRIRIDARLHAELVRRSGANPLSPFFSSYVDELFRHALRKVAKGNSNATKIDKRPDVSGPAAAERN